MHIENTTLDGVKKISLLSFQDFRGEYLETFNLSNYKDAGLFSDFIQDDISTSHQNVLRGIHGDSETWKLISCLYGSFYLIVVNNDPQSSQYKKWESFTLSDQGKTQILIPPKFGNGHLVISEKAIFHYKQSTFYNPSGQFTIKWNDPEFHFSWPISTPLLSKRDERGFF